MRQKHNMVGKINNLVGKINNLVGKINNFIDYEYIRLKV